MEMKDKIQEWNTCWGDVYNLERKNQYREFLLRLSYLDILGRTLIDVGCGIKSVIDHLPSHRHKKVFVDLSSGIYQRNPSSSHDTYIRMDLHRLTENNHRDFKRFMKKLYTFLGEERGNRASSGLFHKLGFVDSIVYSDILNYIDYRNVMRALYKNLRSGGRKIIFNKINMGFQHLLSPSRPKSNWELLCFLQHDLRMVIEYRESYPIIRGDPHLADHAVFVIIAKKK